MLMVVIQIVQDTAEMVAVALVGGSAQVTVRGTAQVTVWAAVRHLARVGVNDLALRDVWIQQNDNLNPHSRHYIQQLL